VKYWTQLLKIIMLALWPSGPFTSSSCDFSPLTTACQCWQLGRLTLDVPRCAKFWNIISNKRLPVARIVLNMGRQRP